MAIYSANRPNRTVTLHKDNCRRIPRDNLEACGCGETGERGNQQWFCEDHLHIEDIDQFMNGRQWALLLCETCYS